VVSKKRRHFFVFSNAQNSFTFLILTILFFPMKQNIKILTCLFVGCFLLLCAGRANAQNIVFPDASFKNALVNMPCVDTDGSGTGDADADTNNDGEIQVSEALAIRVLIFYTNQIADLTGIQNFTNLEYLDCSSNLFTSLDVQGLMNLQTLKCTDNALTNLNVQGLTNLQTLICYRSQLPSLNVQGLTNLQTLECDNNQLPSLNVQGLTNLRSLRCASNQLTSLNVQGLTNLEQLSCGYNQLPSLNLQGLTNLRLLFCSYNQLPDLNVQGLTNLQVLDCENNQLPSLNVQGLTNLQVLSCIYNQLPSLNVQGLMNLHTLHCSHNQLPSLNVQGLTNLNTLSCSYNQLPNLNVQGLTSLWNLECSHNQFPNLNVQGLTNLEWLDCSSNQLPSLNVQGLMNLKVLYCSANQLTNLNVQDLSSLQRLICNNNPIACLSFLPPLIRELNITNTNITCIPNNPDPFRIFFPRCTASNPNGCQFAASIYGKAFIDNNQNCMLETSDSLSKNLLIQVRDTATQAVYTVNSQAGGIYEIALPAPATYEVRALLANNNYWQACPPQTVFLPGNSIQIQADLGITPVVACADMEINHQLSNIARPCSTAHYSASYFNAGTIMATGITAKITLPDSLTMQTASLPFSALGNNEYQIVLPNTAVLERNTFTFSAFVACGATMGQMLCTDVQITPITYCNTSGSGWDGSDIEVTGRCIGNDSIRFVIHNAGQGNMATARNYTVIEDVVMIRGNAFQLAAGASDSITVPANPQRIYRMIADEAPDNPTGNTQETFMVWGCGGISSQIHWGFVNNFGLNNGRVNPHQLCSEVRTSYDPNDIKGTPEGVGSEHFIVKNSDLEYKIRFQNTGNDTAFVVRLINKLPTELDPATLRIGAASHPFTWRLASNGVLEFLFQNILLPDSTTNEPRSNGFVTYKIKMKPNLANGTTINNQAGIYFDYNPVVLTNIYTHTIGETLANFLAVPQIVDNTYDVTLFPNPAHDDFTIKINSKQTFDITKTQFTLFNTLGQRIKTQQFTNETLQVQCNDLPKGVYFYTINQDSKRIAQGKLVVQ
jgi:Leucine-rich repeat (LRR) protein